MKGFNLYRKICVFAFLVGLLLTFQNCNPFSSNLDGNHDGNGPRLQSDYDIALVDWSYANSIANKVMLNDHGLDIPLAYFGNEIILIRNGAGRLIGYNVKTDRYETLIELNDGSIKTVMPFYDLKKIFYTATSGLDGKQFLWVFNVMTKELTQLIEVNKSLDCGRYPTETRIKTILCGVPHSTKTNDVSAILVNAQSNQIIHLAETDGTVNLDYSFMQDMYDVQYQYRRNTFLFPNENKAILTALDVATHATKFYLFSATGITEFKPTEKENFWGDAIQMTVADAMDKMVIGPNYTQTPICGTANFTGTEIGNATTKHCTPAGMLALVISASGYTIKLCSALNQCEIVELKDGNINWSKYLYTLASNDQSSIILTSSSLSNNMQLQGLFVFDPATKKTKKIFDQGPFVNRTKVISKVSSADYGTFLVTSPQFFDSVNGTTQAQAFYDVKTKHTYPLPFGPKNLGDTTTYATFKDGDFYAAVQASTGETQNLFAITTNLTTIYQPGYSYLKTYQNKFTTNSQVFLQKSLGPNGGSDIFQWNLTANTVNKLFSDSQTIARGLNGLFKNDKIMFYRKSIDTMSKCTSVIRDVITGISLFEITADASNSCAQYGAFDTGKSFIFLSEETYPTAGVYRYDYATKAATRIGSSKYSGNVGVLHLAETYYTLGDAVLDSNGDLIMNYGATLYDSFVGRGNLIYGLRSFRDNENTLVYQMQELNPKTKEIKDLERIDVSNITLVPIDAGFHYTFVKTSDGLDITTNGLLFRLRGSGFAQKNNFISYYRRNANGSWQFVSTDITQNNMNETIYATKETYSDLMVDVNFARQLFHTEN